jgi:hypothetical protein
MEPLEDLGNISSKKPTIDTENPVNDTEEMDITDDTTLSSFVQTYPVIYPPDWILSPANNYKKPPSNPDQNGSALAFENERRLSLCLSPFSKEFFIATGCSRLQVPDDYLEIIRVRVWNNR